MASEESVASELAAVFNFTNLSDGRALLNLLEYGKEDSTNSYFIDFIKNLPVLRNFGISSNSDEAMIKMIKGPRRKINNVLAAEEKSGSWGTVRFGKNYVYKEVRVEDEKKGEELNTYYKNALCEVVIQVILSCDPLHSGKVPQIINVFKRTPEAKSIWIQMEKMEKTFLEFLLPPSPRPTLASLLPYFKDLCETLEYLQETYKFNHRDMKPDNLMIKDGKIKLIDFGYSILTFGGKTYSGTSVGGYERYYFSKHLDIILMSLVLRFRIKPTVNRPYHKFFAPQGDSLKFFMFLNDVLTNIPNKVKLSEYASINSKEKKELDLSGAILNLYSNNSQKLREFKGRAGLDFWLIGYNWKGEYLDNQFTFPFATPMGFLELYKKLLKPDEEADEDYASFVQRKLYTKSGGFTNKRRIRKNRKTRRRFYN
jgi:hypothetical protein